MIACGVRRPFKQPASNTGAEPRRLHEELLEHSNPRIDSHLRNANDNSVFSGDLDLTVPNEFGRQREFLPARLHEFRVVPPRGFRA